MEKNDRVIGTRHNKFDALQKVMGETKFTGDLSFPGMLHVKILRSPHAHANIKEIDTTKAQGLKGVKAVITHADVPKIPTMHQFLHMPDVMFYDSYLLEEKVRHVGDRIAAVAATDPDIAEEALELIEVEYDPLPAVFDPVESLQDDAPRIHAAARRGDQRQEILNNTVGTREFEVGDVAKGFQEADLLLEDTFTTSRPNNVPLERTAVVCVPAAGGNLEVYGTTQGIHAMRMNIASSLGIPLKKINCHRVFLGGSFGAHIHTGWIEPICAFLALLTGSPVRGEKSREEMFLTCGRHPMILTLKTGVKEDGRLVAMHLDVIDETGAYAFSGESKMVLAGGWFLSMYRCPNMKFTGRTVYTNTPPLTAMRGAGNPQVNFAVESQMDIVAEALGMDPIKLRLFNHIREGDTFYGQGPDVVSTVESCGTEQLIEWGAKKIAWNTRDDHSTSTSRIRRGIGMARGFHTSGAGSAKPSRFIMDYSGASVQMNEDGSAVLFNAVGDLGQGSQSTHAALVAEELGIRYEDVILHPGDTNSTLFDVPTHASRATYGMGLAVLEATKRVKGVLLNWASEMLETPADSLVARDNQIYDVQDPQNAVTIKDVVQAAQANGWGSATGSASVRPSACPPHFVVIFIEVEVDIETGQVVLRRALSGADVGTPINPKNIEGQLEGGLHMGLGYALLEDTCIDLDSGMVLNPNLHDYRMLTSLDMPAIETTLADTYEPTGPFGAKGVGEGATNPVAAAVANAIYHAIGVRIKHLPITSEKIRRALHQSQGAANEAV